MATKNSAIRREFSSSQKWNLSHFKQCIFPLIKWILRLLHKCDLGAFQFVLSITLIIPSWQTEQPWFIRTDALVWGT